MCMYSNIEYLDGEEGKYLLFSWIVLQYQPLKPLFFDEEIKSSHYQCLQVQEISMQR